MRISSGTGPLSGSIARGKVALPSDADAGAFVDQLKRALHTVECRELGPTAAKERFGPYADTHTDPMVLSIAADQLLARHPEHDELPGLLRAVQERGPAVGVTLGPPRT